MSPSTPFSTRFSSFFPKKPASWGKIGVFLLLGGALAFLLAPDAEGNSNRSFGSFISGEDSDSKILNVALLGVSLSLQGSSSEVEERASAIVKAYLRDVVDISVKDGEKKQFKREELGAYLENERLSELVLEVKNPRSALRRAHKQMLSRKKDAVLNLSVPVRVLPEKAIPNLLQMKDELDKPPSDARFDFEAGKLLPDSPGKRMDVYATLALIEDAFRKGEKQVLAASESVPAKRSLAGMGNVDISDVLGYFETKYARDLKHEARTFNLRLAASRFDGYILKPGEVFEFNKVVGPRSEANGYKVAPVIAQGELVDGIGGGTCQVAGTLHGAAFFAGLGIEERKPHTRPSFYIKMGLDAAVSYPSITLRLSNPFPFPVVLHETVQNGMVRAEILGPKRTRDVTFSRVIEEVIPFQEKEVLDSKVPKGKKMLSQRGIPGFKLTRLRVLRDGSFAVRERTSDVYPATQQIWKVGTGPKDPKFEARDDEHPEYIADEVLVISQGPSIPHPRLDKSEAPKGGFTVESRVPGKYGVHGWTVKEGFAKTLSANAKKDSDDRPD